MDVFFNAKSIAILGVSRNPHKDGNNILKNLMMKEEGLTLYPINPFADEILGHKVYPSVLDVEDSIDLAILFIPPNKALKAAEECVQKGVKAIIIESAGFNEVGNWDLYNQIKEITAEAGVRVWGPNCTGFADFHAEFFTGFAPMDQMLEGIDVNDLKGNVSVISQSGMMAGGLMFTIITGMKFKLNKLCAIGNKLDVNECDILEYLAADPKTEVIGVYLEGFADGKRFLKLARQTTPRKPIVLLSGGRSEGGFKAASSHTGTITSKSEHLEDLLKQAGVIQVEDFSELLDTLTALSILKEKNIPLPQRGNVAIVTISGGAGVVLSDQLAKQGNLTMAEYSDKTRKKIDECFPEWMVTGRYNPCDAWPAVEVKGPLVFPDILDAIFKDPNVDLLLITIFAARNEEWQFVQNSLFRSFIRKHKKTVVSWIFGDYTQFDEARIDLKKGGIPLYTSIQTCMKILSRMVWYGNFLKNKSE